MAYSISSSVTKIGSSLRNNKRGRYGNNNNNNNNKQNRKTHNNSNSNCTSNDDNDFENIKANYTKWCAQLKIELKQKSKINVDVRLEKMENIVNDVIDSELPKERASNFYISDDDKKEMMKQIEDKIDSWRGVEIEVCRNKEKKNFEAYQATARNWFNRNKAKIYGNHLFYEIIYNHILKFCAEIEGITEEKRMILFIDVFERILAEPVQFPRTKLQPLLPHQSLMQPNRFKKASEQFTMIYNTRWMLANNSANNSKRDRDRAKKIHTSFTNCLNQIKQQLQTQSASNPPMPFPFESIMNDTGSSTKSITSSTKSISIDYEINDSVANHSPMRSSRRKKPASSSSLSSSASPANNDGDFKLSMVDHSSTGSTESTQSKDNDDMNQDDEYHRDTGYIDGYDEQYVDDEYMKDLPPTVEMGGYQNPHHMISRQYNRSRPFGRNPRMNNMNNINNINYINRHRSTRNTFINDNVMAHGIVTGNHLINDVIDEVVYDDNFKIEQTNNGYYDGTYTMYQSSEYRQDPVNNNNLNINNHISNAYNLNNQQNYHNNNNNNSNNSMLCIDREITIPSIQQNSNIATIQVQQPFIPQFPNNGNFVTLPTLNGPFPINNNHIPQQYDINDNQRIQHIQHIQRSVPMLRSQQSTNSTHSHTMSINTTNQGNITPETTLTGQSSSSSSSSSSDSSLSSGGYAPSRGTNKSLNVSNKRYSPISTPPKTPTTTPTTPRMRNRASNTSTNSSNSSSTPMNYNDYTIVNNPRMIDSYQITPFSPSFDQHHNNNHNNNNYVTAPPQFNQLDNNGMMMDNMNNDTNVNIPPMMNNDGVFTNLSNISSPTPLLGGFL